MKQQTRAYYESGITRFERQRPSLLRRVAILIVLVLLPWVGIPAVHAGLLLWSSPLRSAPTRPHSLSVRSVHFRASDGVTLRGWFVPAGNRAPTVILVSGFKGDRSSMVPYARFLHAARFNVLLYDSRGTGASEGSFSLGLREVDDVRGAVTYLDRRHDLRVHRYGLLGVSLGAGVAIVAAAHLRSVLATVADSPYTDQTKVVDRLDTLDVGSVAIPLAPIGPWIVDRVLGARLASFSPLRSVRRIAPRALLLIHSRYDRNPTTTLHDVERLRAAVGRTASLWIAPHGGHARALAVQRAVYTRIVDTFFRRYLH